MSKALTVHNAEIKTAAVEIRTLTISGKQVTLAVFRQLREEPLIADDGTLNGVPWGIVNYHPDKCGGSNSREHWHVVWQRGAELLRSAVIQAPAWSPYRAPTGAPFFSAHVRDVLLGVDSRHFGGGIPEVDGSIVIELHGIRVMLEPSRAVRAAVWSRDDLEKATASAQTSEYIHYRDADGFQTYGPWSRAEPLLRRRVDDALRDLDQEIGPREGGTEELFVKLKAEVGEESARQARHTAQRKALADLPQLFIAV